MRDHRCDRVTVAIVGAGFGGLAVARELAAAGESDFVVLDRAERVGGTWQANTYPGVACDAPSHLYRYASAPSTWSRRFAPGGEIRDYLERCVDHSGLRDHLRLGTSVTSARWTGSEWELELGDGGIVLARVLVAATGQLEVPSVPDLPGADGFPGPAFHTAEWRHDVSLAGKRVAVVGTGASAIQVVPAIVEEAAQVTVFQRSAPHVFPKPDAEYDARLRRLHERVPIVPGAARVAITAGFEAFNLFFWKWPRLMGLMDGYHQKALAAAVPDPELRARLTPTDRPGCKRPLVSSDWHRCFTRDDVTLETDRLAAVEGSALVTAAGTRHEADVLVWATGFRTDTFASRLRVVGRDGVLLEEAWADGAAAYLGLSVPGFPNLFCVYGPNTNLGAGSIVTMMEAQALHVVDAVQVLRAAAGKALEVRRGTFEDFREELAPRLARAVWSSGCANWYLDARGRDTHNWPGSVRAYRRRTQRVSLADYALVPAPVAVSAGC